MIEQIIGKSQTHSLKLFSQDEIDWLEGRIFKRQTKRGEEFAVKCFVREKEIKLTPEEVVRQLYAHRLVEDYDYPVSRLAFEFPVYFGRETKRADIVVRDKNDLNVPYIVVEVKKPKAKDGREQLKSYTHATGASMAVWTNGEAITYHQRKNPNFFEDIPNIPRDSETLADILNTPFTMDDLFKIDKLTQTGKSLKDLVLEMEDEVLANAGVDVFEEVFKLIFAKLYDEKIGTADKSYNLEFRNSGQSDIELKAKIEKLFKKACDEWPGVFPDDARIALTPPHLSICVASLETVKLFNSNLDVVDDAFEYLMNKSSKGEKGQYFTPRYVIDMCVRMLDPKPSETMIDTAAGSSGFPVHTIFHVWREMQLAANKPVSHLFTAAPKGHEETDYVRKKVFAIDFDEKTVRVARTLNLIAGDGHTNVLHLNTLDFGRWDAVTKERDWIDTYNEGYKKLRKLEVNGDTHRYFEFDIVMANPPFAGEIKEGQLLSRYDFGNKDGKPQRSVGRDILFIERNINFLGAGGRMAIVLPQGRFNNATDQYIRRFIAERCRILAVIGLDGNTFKPHTGTKTSVLFVQKWQPDKNQPNYNPKRDDYPIFFATQRKEGKNSRGDKIYWTKDKSGTTTDPKLALLDQYGHPIIYHDLFATYNYIWDKDKKTNRLERLTPDGIAEAFAQFAAKEKLSFFSLTPFDKTRYSELLKGLEISEVALSALERTWRLDAEFYAKGHLKVDALLRAREAVSLHEFALISDGNHMGVSDEFCMQGVPYFRGGDIKEFFLSFGRPEYCVPKDVYMKPTMLRSHMKKGDVFVSIVGAIIGQIGMKTDDAPALCSCKLGILRPKNIKTGAYLAAFLLSSIGQSQIWRFRRGSAQTGLILDDFEQLFAPKFSGRFYDKITDIVQAALRARGGAVDKIQSAEQSLLSELGFDGWTPTEESVSVKNCSDFMSAGRFDAEYFQPKYDDYFNMITKYRNGHKRLGDLTIQNTTQCDKTVSDYDYIEIGDVDVGNATYCSTHLSVDDLPANAKIMAHKGDLIISKVRPNRGAVAIIEDDRSDLVVSGAFTVVASKDEFSRECLLVLLRTNVYRDWLLRWAVGSSYPVVKDEDVLNMPIPLFDKDIQQTIAAKVRQSFALRAESKRLLDLAKHAVEVAIEQGESKAMEVLGEY